MFIQKYGANWKCSIHLVEDRIAEKALKFSKAKMWGQAFEIVVRNDVATEGQRMREDWNCLDTIDIILVHDASFVLNGLILDTLSFFYRSSSHSSSHLFPSQGERFYVEALNFLIDQNLNHIQNLIEYRKKLDFFAGAVRYTKKIESIGMHYTLPSFTEERKFLIEELWNPCLLLQDLGKEKIVCNNAEFDGNKNITILTGANNTGKSIYVKSIGLAYALAQNGFPIPARKASLMELDAIYTDFTHPEDIEKGEGALLDELNRVKRIINKANDRSLIILDEPIRGTSPEDSEEICSRIIERFEKINSPTYLVTHHHKLAEKVRKENVKYLMTEVNFEEEKPKITLKTTYKIKDGIAGKSYGVELANEIGI